MRYHRNAKHTGLISLGLIAGLLSCSALGMIVLSQTQPIAKSGMIGPSRRPLLLAAGQLEERYARPVTYEELIPVWAGDIDRVTTPQHPLPRWLSFRIPDGLDPAHTPILDKAALGRVVEAYHAQTDGPRYQVYESPWGLHIVAWQGRDVTGQAVQVKPFLDYPINVAKEKRTPSGHFRELCKSISSCSGIDLKASTDWLDEYYAPNGAVPTKDRMFTSEEREQISFVWGASNIKARDALMDFLQQSSTTLTWRLTCDPGADCWFSLAPLQVRVTEPDGSSAVIALRYDRCKKCPPLPGKK